MNKYFIGVILASVMVAGVLSAQTRIESVPSLDDPLLHSVTVQVTPRYVIFDQRTKSVTLTFTNPGDSVLDADVSIAFYDVVTDTTGILQNQVVAMPASSAPSAASWVHGLPSHITLQPHVTQSATLTLQVPAGTPNGEYRAKIDVIGEKRVLLPVLINGAPGVYQYKVTLDGDAYVWYRQGAMAMGLALTHPQITVVGDSAIRACLHLQSTGSAHFAGTMHWKLHAVATGKDTTGLFQEFAIYQTQLDPCYVLPVSTLPAGQYTMSITVDNVRTDIPSALRLPFTPVTISSPITIGPHASH